MIKPIDINLNSLPSVALAEKHLLPDFAAIYFVIDIDGNIQYIGQAKNTRKRWLGHHRTPQLELMNGVRIAFLTVNDTDLLNSIEQACIEFFTPALNSTPFLNNRVRIRAKETLYIQQVADYYQESFLDALYRIIQFTRNATLGVSQTPLILPNQPKSDNQPKPDPIKVIEAEQVNSTDEYEPDEDQLDQFA